MSGLALDNASDISLFLLKTPSGFMEMTGCREKLPGGPADSLGERVCRFFAEQRFGSPLLVGALPFDPNADDALYQPERTGEPILGGVEAPHTLLGEVVAEPTPAAYAEMVAGALERLRSNSDALRKLVLARSLSIRTSQAVNPRALAVRLARDPSVATYVVPLPANPDEQPAWLVGASPELLISRRGRTVGSHPLAGSARRSADADEDAYMAEALLASAKDLDEHRYVVDAIVDTLAPLCVELNAPSQPALYATATMWHLGTRIRGVLKDHAPSAAALAGLLHPTPAVCGTPRAAALNAIQALEPVSRGFYAGAVGWNDANGDGDWYVAIRCARVQGNDLRLFAGAGIVAGSCPEGEVIETSGKFMAFLNALGINDECMIGIHDAGRATVECTSFQGIFPQ